MTRDGNLLLDMVTFGDGRTETFRHERICTEGKCRCPDAFGTWLVRMVVMGGDHMQAVNGGDAWRQERSRGVER